ncbi:MAG: hypothetical protein K6E38_07100, partial [Fretibacterium sp.]|nr:hypothetical protein [Fretibacterium sp.]
SEIKRKLDDLNELLSQNYITDAEYAIARENVLADAGIDIVPRLEGPVIRDNVRSLRSVTETQRGSGCGCFLVLLLLLVAAAGCLLALPEDIAQKIPGMGQLIDEPRYQEIRQTITQFIDDLRGNPAPAPAPDPVPAPTPAPSSSASPAPEISPQKSPTAVPDPELPPRRRPRRTSNFNFTADSVPERDTVLSEDSLD